MKSMKTYTEIPFLLSKALLGTLSEEEERALQQWRDESPENEQLYESEMNTEYIVQKSHEVARVNIVNGYMNVLQKRKRNVRVRRVRRIVSIAAGVVLPLLNKREDRGRIGTGYECHPAWRGESGVSVGGRNNSDFGFGSDRFVARPARGKYCRAKSRGELPCGFFRCRRAL